MANVGQGITAKNSGWTFEGEVSKTFDEHVSKSVPLYDVEHDLVAKLSDYFLGDGSTFYEIGCSTAQLTKRVADRNEGKKIRMVGIDPVSGMVAEARRKCAGDGPIEIVQGDILEYDLEPADMIVSYYTIQFIRPRVRQIAFDKIYQSLNWGGGFALFEKVRAPDARFQDMMSGLYVDFKLDQGFDEQEIVHKTLSLKYALEPFSTQGNIDMMRRAGFVDVMSVFKYAAFEGFLAIK